MADVAAPVVEAPAEHVVSLPSADVAAASPVAGSDSVLSIEASKQLSVVVDAVPVAEVAAVRLDAMAANQLAVTGADTTGLAGIGFVLVIVGAALVRIGRRRPAVR